MPGKLDTRTPHQIIEPCPLRTQKDGIVQAVGIVGMMVEVSQGDKGTGQDTPTPPVTNV